jgi:hypothetical protein
VQKIYNILCITKIVKIRIGIMTFFGRNEELGQLSNLLEKKTASLVVLKGRRRIGKSRLIEEFAKREKIRILTFSGLPPIEKTTIKDQLHEFGPYLLDERPIMEEGLVKDGKFKKPFVIVHQYDRVPEWKKIIDSKYKTEEEPVYFVYHT